jgi:ribosomal protein S21
MESKHKNDKPLEPLEVQVKDNNVIQAYRRLKRMMLKEGIAEDLQRREERHLRIKKRRQR